MLFAALVSVWVLVLTSSREDTCNNIEEGLAVEGGVLTMNLHTILSNRLAAGHSGQ